MSRLADFFRDLDEEGKDNGKGNEKEEREERNGDGDGGEMESEAVHEMNIAEEVGYAYLDSL
jgi:hypothetical protein